MRKNNWSCTLDAFHSVPFHRVEVQMQSYFGICQADAHPTQIALRPHIWRTHRRDRPPRLDLHRRRSGHQGLGRTGSSHRYAQPGKLPRPRRQPADQLVGSAGMARPGERGSRPKDPHRRCSDCADFDQIDMSKVPKYNVTDGTCAGTPGAITDGRCWWTCGGCSECRNVSCESFDVRLHVVLGFAALTTQPAKPTSPSAPTR